MRVWLAIVCRFGILLAMGLAATSLLGVASAADEMSLTDAAGPAGILLWLVFVGIERVIKIVKPGDEADMRALLTELRVLVGRLDERLAAHDARLTSLERGVPHE